MSPRRQLSLLSQESGAENCCPVILSDKYNAKQKQKCLLQWFGRMMSSGCWPSKSSRVSILKPRDLIFMINSFELHYKWLDSCNGWCPEAGKHSLGLECVELQQHLSQANCCILHITTDVSQKRSVINAVMPISCLIQIWMVPALLLYMKSCFCHGGRSICISSDKFKMAKV